MSDDDKDDVMIFDCDQCGREMEWEGAGEQNCPRCGNPMFWDGCIYEDGEDYGTYSEPDDPNKRASKHPPNHPTFAFVDCPEVDLTAGRYRRIIHAEDCGCEKHIRLHWYDKDVPEKVCPCGKKFRFDNELLDYSIEEEKKEEKEKEESGESSDH